MMEVSFRGEPTPPRSLASSPTRTLFVTEVAPNVSAADLEQLFHLFRGFRCVRRLPNFAFVEFDSSENATDALVKLQGHKFGPHDRGLVLDYDKDGDRDRKRKSDESAVQSRPFFRRSTGSHAFNAHFVSRTPYDDRYPRPEVSHLTPQEVDQYFDPPRAPTAGWTAGGYPTMFPGLTLPRAAYGRVDAVCPTLCVKNLPDDVREREMSILFRFMPGFDRVRLVAKEGRAPICFVDFVNADSAAMARQVLQIGGPGIIIEYDKGRLQMA